MSRYTCLKTQEEATFILIDLQYFSIIIIIIQYSQKENDLYRDDKSTLNTVKTRIIQTKALEISYLSKTCKHKKIERCTAEIRQPLFRSY